MENVRVLETAFFAAPNGLTVAQEHHLHHPFGTRLLRPSASEWTKSILRRHSAVFAKRWSATGHSLPALRRRATRRSPAPTDDRPTQSPFVGPGGYRPSPSVAGWRFFPLLYAAAFSCRSSSESERFESPDISRGFWSFGQSPGARSLLAAVAAALGPSRFAAEVPPTRAIDSMLRCHLRDGKCVDS